MFSRILPAIAFTLTLGACAVGNTYEYGAAKPNLIAESTRSVSATVVDYRPYVVSGNKSPTFVGLQRGGYGNPFNVNTKSGRPLAEDLTNGLAHALTEKGIAAKALILPVGTEAEKALARSAAQGTDRLLIIMMREWKTDALLRLTLHWDLDAAVYDRSGRVLASHEISGVSPVADVAFDLEGGKNAIALQQINMKLSELLNQPEIVAALR